MLLKAFTTCVPGSSRCTSSLEVDDRSSSSVIRPVALGAVVACVDHDLATQRFGRHLVDILEREVTTTMSPVAAASSAVAGPSTGSELVRDKTDLPFPCRSGTADHLVSGVGRAGVHAASAAQGVVARGVESVQ
jgi:hypothetical protein